MNRPPPIMEPEDEVRRWREECERLREPLEVIARGACLRQINRGVCICYTCLARTALNTAKSA